MNKTIHCPPAHALSELINGKLVDPELSDYSSHLEDCSHCQNKVKTLFPMDTLVNSLRGEASGAEKTASKIPDLLIDALKQIPRTDSDANLSRDGLSHSNGMSLDDLGLSFLSPPLDWADDFPED